MNVRFFHAIVFIFCHSLFSLSFSLYIVVHFFLPAYTPARNEHGDTQQREFSRGWWKLQQRRWNAARAENYRNVKIVQRVLTLVNDTAWNIKHDGERSDISCYRGKMDFL